MWICNGSNNHSSNNNNNIINYGVYLSCNLYPITSCKIRDDGHNLFLVTSYKITNNGLREGDHYHKVGQ